MALRCKLRRSTSVFALAGFLFLLSGQVGAEHVLSQRFKLPKASASKIMFGNSPSSPFDLDQQRLHFAPNASGGYEVSALAFAFETDFGTNLNSADDTNHRVTFAQGFSFKIYDVLGHEVATLVNEKQRAGRHFVTFDGGGLTDGAYLYRLEAEGASETRKLVLLK